MFPVICYSYACSDTETGEPFLPADTSIASNSVRSARASLAARRLSNEPLLMLVAKAATSSFTPQVISVSVVAVSNVPSLDLAVFTTFFIISTRTLPLSVTISKTIPRLNSLPRQMLKEPKHPSLVFRIAAIVSAGASASWSKLVCAETLVTLVFRGASRCLSTAVKCTPPSRRYPPWKVGFCRLIFVNKCDRKSSPGCHLPLCVKEWILRISEIRNADFERCKLPSCFLQLTLSLVDRVPEAHVLSYSPQYRWLTLSKIHQLLGSLKVWCYRLFAENMLASRQGLTNKSRSVGDWDGDDDSVDIRAFQQRI